jgi:DNA polymerase-3 subunit beta
MPMGLLLERIAFLKGLESLIPGMTQKAHDFFSFKASGDNVSLISSNSEVLISTQLGPIENKKNFDICLPFSSIYSIVQNLTQDFLEIIWTENSFSINGELGTYNFNIFNKERSEQEQVSLTSTILLPYKTFKDLYYGVEFSCAKEASRYSMNGVYFKVENNEIVSAGTDGRRLAICSKKIPNSHEDIKEFLLPNKTLGSILKNSINIETEDLEIGIGDSFVVFKQGGVKVVLQRILGNFPDFKNIIPKKSSNKILGNLEVFKKLLKQIMVFSENDYPVVFLEVKGRELEMVANSSSIGSCSLKMEVELKGEGGGIAFNPKFLLDGINHTSKENFMFEFNNSDSPGVIKLNENNSYIMMPVTKI